MSHEENFQPSPGPYKTGNLPDLPATILLFDSNEVLIGGMRKGGYGEDNAKLMRESWAMHQLLLKLKQQLELGSPDRRHQNWIEDIDQQLKKLEV